MTEFLRRLPALALCAPILAYRWLISPVLPAACRFHPSCSAYALEAVRQHGALAGGCLAVRRILRCHPWGGQGYDPVPDPVGRAASPHHPIHPSGSNH
ncbi:MAG: membrane protein insertion efficiency factor YidD [Rhodospirillales bacterium]